MNDKIMNEDFEVGEKYRGLVDGSVLTVVDIRQPGTYPAPGGGISVVKSPTIYFFDEDGRAGKTGLENAKRLLLEKIEEPQLGLDEKLVNAEARAGGSIVFKKEKEAVKESEL